MKRIPSNYDRRKVIVRLTNTGLDLVDDIASTHLDTERGLLKTLPARQRNGPVRSLRTLLLDLGDRDNAPPDRAAELRTQSTRRQHRRLSSAPWCSITPAAFTTS